MLGVNDIGDALQRVFLRTKLQSPYRGIGGRDFERRFQLADHVKVTSAKLEKGLLSIDLQRELPEEKKPRAIPIEGQAAPKTITHQ